MNEWQDAEAHAERAHKYYESGQWAKALTELRRALAVDPQQSEWHFGMGLTLEAMGRHAEAADAFERVLELRGEDIETLVSLALNLNRANEPRRAIRVLERVNQIEPDHEPGYCLRIESYAMLGDHENAELMFYMARQFKDECPACFDYIARSLVQRHELDRALWCWHQTVRLEPYYPGVYMNMARIHWHRGQYVRAQRLLLKQLRQDPGDIATLLELGRLLIEMDHEQDAAEKFRRVLELDGSSAEARLHLGELALHAGDFHEAQRELELARRLDPRLAGIYLGLAQLAYQNQQPEVALTLVREELVRRGQNPLQMLDIARLLIDLDHPSPVPRVLRPIIDGPKPTTGRQREHLITALLYRGVALTMLGRPSDSVVDYRQAVRLQPKHTLAMQNLALAYLELGRLRHASYWLRRASRVVGNDPVLRQLRRRIVVARARQFFGANAVARHRKPL